MAYAAFPSAINQIVEQQNYGETPDADIETFKADQNAGAPILRQRSLNPQDVIGCKMWLSSADWDTLKTFYRATLLDGSQPFTWVHPRNLSAGVFQFEGPAPKLNSVQGPMYEITFTLRLLSGGGYSGTVLEADVGVNLGYGSPAGDDIAVQ